MIKDRTLATYDGEGKHLSVANVGTVIVHRISLALKSDENPDPIPDADLDALELVCRFRRGPLSQITGGRPPYHVLIRANATATAEQVLPLLVQGAHCKKWNWRSWGVAVVGDFRDRPATDIQWEMLRRVLVDLCQEHREIRAHTDMPTGADPTSIKSCPGRYLPIEPLISRVMVCDRRPLDPDPMRALELAGYRL